MTKKTNTSGTRGESGSRDRTLAVKRRKKRPKISFFCKNKNYNKKIFFLHISSSYAKIFGETPPIRKRTDFWAFFLLFTASVRSRPPGTPIVPGVFYLNNVFQALKLLCSWNLVQAACVCHPWWQLQA